ncbi:uncharacterized protein RHO25_006047 [Cercospora beticola]|uniref:F-box domain-containing protein n=1 Tax=Cercospora beticola TaxID=122368 RepID=A0ABZ0NPL2_CERBT|nr:hypothetical protein RHO25_006047 [Cercospora beticola]
MTPRTQTPAERVFSLLELCEPILEELPIQDLIRVSHVSRAFFTKISSSKLLRQRILRWRECDLNDLALNDDYASFPTGFVSSFDFDTPYLRTREPPWIFHTMFGYGHGLRYEERKNLSAENGILVIYRCTEAEEYFVYVPFSVKFPVMALRLSKLVFDHASYTFTPSWSSRLEDWNGDLRPVFTESYQGRTDYSAFSFAYFQTWYTTDIATSTSSSLASERMANTEMPTRNTVNWKHWAQVHGKFQPLPDKKRGWKTWLQHKGRKIKPSEKTAKSIRTDVEELDLKCEVLHSFVGAALDFTFLQIVVGRFC